MLGSADPIEVILQLRNLRTFQAGMAEASASVRGLGKASAETDAAAAARSRKSAGVLGLVSKAAKGTALGVAAIGFEAVKMSANFQQEMLRVHTQAGLPIGRLKAVSNAVLDIAKHSQQGPVDLARALFHLQSVSGGAGKALNSESKILRALSWTSKLAAMSGADLESTTNAVAAAAMVGIPGLRGFHNIIRQLNATAGAGNMRMSDLVYTLSSGILPVAKLAGLHFRDVGASLAILADEGIRGYSAGAQLRTSLHYLYAPTAKARDALKEMGLTAAGLHKVLADPSKGLPGALAVLRNHLEGLSKSKAAHVLASLGAVNQLPGTAAKALSTGALGRLGDLFPAGRGTVLQVLMNQVDRFGGKYHQMAGIAASTDKSIALQQQTTIGQIHTAWSSLQVALVKFGDQIRGPVTAAITWLIHRLADLVTIIGNVVTWFGKHKTVARDLGIAILILVGVIGAYRLAVIAAQIATKAWAIAELVAVFIRAAAAGGIMTAAMTALDVALNANPVAIIILAIAALAVGFIELYKHSEKFRHIINTIWSVIKTVFGWIAKHWKLLIMGMSPLIGFFVLAFVHNFDKIKSVVLAVVGFIKKHWRLMLAVLTMGLSESVIFIIGHWKGISSAVGSVLGTVVGVIKGFISGIISVINTMIDAYNAAFGWATGNISKIGDPFASAGPTGPVPSTSAAQGVGGKTSNPLLQPWNPGHGVRIPGKGKSTHKTAKAASLDSPFMPGGGKATLHLEAPVIINGREVARAVSDHVLERQARS